MHHRKIAIRTLAEVLGANLLFFVVDGFSEDIESISPPGMGKAMVLSLHLLLVMLMVFIVARFFRQVDEYLRRQMLENLAVTTAVIFIGACLYGSLEAVGFHRLSMFVICPAVGITFAVVSIIRRTVIR